MIKIAIYGKGGIGKSTTTSNLSGVLSLMGYKVMQIGCDPKADSTRLLMGGKKIPTVLDTIKEKGKEIQLEDIVYEGFNGVLCVESGGPTPGIGCAGRGIIAAFDKLEELKAYEVYKPDIVLYDVLGDVVCGGFAMPMREGYADRVYIVTSGEMMSMYAATNIAHALESFKTRGYAKYGGIILNSRGVENEVEMVEKLVSEIGGEIIGIIPREPLIQKYEKLNQTLVEGDKTSKTVEVYKKIAEKFMEESNVL